MKKIAEKEKFQTCGIFPRKMEDNEEYIQRIIKTMQTYQIDTINRYSYMQKALRDSSLRQKEILLNSGFGKYF